MDGFGGIPCETHRLLLRAALLPGGDGLRAWEAWIAQTDIDTLDGGSLRLIPLLYVRLKRDGIDHHEMGRFKGIYRHCWYKNQLLIAGVAPVLQSFERARIPTLMLKGAALLHGWYPDYGLRPMSDFDLLVPVPDAARALQALEGAGWRSVRGRTGLGEKTVAEGREHSFLSPAGHRLDLHWHVIAPGFVTCRPDGLDADFWQGARPVRLSSVETAVPSATDMLLHVCVHGSEGHPSVAPLRWVADAYAILERQSAAGREVDWDRLLEQARQRQLSLPLRDTLGFLAAELGAAVPPGLLRDLEGIPTTRRQRRKYRAWTSPPQRKRASRSLLGRVREALRRYRRGCRDAKWPANAI